jgi:hypothetical protein
MTGSGRQENLSRTLFQPLYGRVFFVVSGFRSLDFLTLQDGTDNLCHCTLRNIPQELRSHLVRFRLQKAQITQNSRENNCIISHAQNTTALCPTVFLTGIHRLLFTSTGRPTVPSASYLSRSTAKLHSHYLCLLSLQIVSTSVLCLYFINNTKHLTYPDVEDAVER